MNKRAIAVVRRAMILSRCCHDAGSAMTMLMTDGVTPMVSATWLV